MTRQTWYWTGSSPHRYDLCHWGQLHQLSKDRTLTLSPAEWGNKNGDWVSDPDTHKGQLDYKA